MAFTENLSVFFNTDDFAVPATLNGSTINGIFNDENREALDGEVYSQMATFDCRESDLSASNIGDTLAITGEGSFVIREVMPDGTGTTKAMLSRA